MKISFEVPLPAKVRTKKVTLLEAKLLEGRLIDHNGKDLNAAVVGGGVFLDPGPLGSTPVDPESAGILSSVLRVAYEKTQFDYFLLLERDQEWPCDGLGYVLLKQR